MKTEEEITARLGQAVVVLGLFCITLAVIIVLMLNRKYYTDVEIGVQEIVQSQSQIPPPGVKESYSPGDNGIDGKKLFKQNCAVCHTTTKVPIAGPGLEGVMQRVPSEEWLHKWIKNADAMKKSGDPYAKEIDKKFSSAMTVFSFLSDDEVNALIDYLKAEAK